jgi:addiction module HigA family antidote
MCVSRLSVNQLVNDKRAVTAEMALRLAKVLGTAPEFWLNLQRAVDLHKAKSALAGKLEQMPVLRKLNE